MKRILTFLSITVLAIILATSVFATENGKSNVIQPGDANADGEINIKDVVLLAQYLAGWDVELGGNHNIVIDEAVEPTCKSTGLTEGKHCSDCGAILVKQQVVPKLEHEFTTIKVSPTVNEQGYTLHDCINCDYSYKDNYVSFLVTPCILTTSEDGYDYLVITYSSKVNVKVLYNDSALNYSITAFDAEFNANNKTPTDGSMRLAYFGYTEANKETKIKLGKSFDVSTAGYTQALIRVGNSNPIRIDRVDDVDGFNDKAAPSVLKTSDDKDIIAFTPYSGAKYGDKVMYMYVSSNKSYTSEAFLATYETVSADLKGEEKNLSPSYSMVDRNKLTKKSSEISEGYVVFMFVSSGRNYHPVTVARQNIGNCISGTPSVVYDVDKANAFISLNAKLPFTLQYFAIDKNTYNKELLAAMFDTGRNIVSNDNPNAPIEIGELSADASTTNKVFAGKNENLALNEDKVIVNENSKYLAIRAVSANGSIKYDPMIVKIETVDDGIRGGDVPNIHFTSKGGMIEITLRASKNAEGKTFEFWYTNTKPETEADFNKVFNETTNRGSWLITSTTTMTIFEAGKWVDLADYKYLAYRVVDNEGNSMTPGYVTIPMVYRANANIKVDQTSGGAMLHVAPFDTEKYTIYWFYSTTQLDITRANFMSNYSKVLSDYKNYINFESAIANEYQYIQTDFAQPSDGTTVYKYIYVCIKDSNNKYYQPVELKVPGTYTVGG